MCSKVLPCHKVQGKNILCITTIAEFTLSVNNVLIEYFGYFVTKYILIGFLLYIYMQIYFGLIFLFGHVYLIDKRSHENSVFFMQVCYLPSGSQLARIIS